MNGGPFGDLPVIGALARADAAVELRKVAEDEAARALESAPGRPARFGVADLWPFGDRAWQHTAHGIGFLPAGGRSGAIPGLGEVAAGTALETQRITIARNALRVAPAAAAIGCRSTSTLATTRPAPTRICTAPLGSDPYFIPTV